MEPCCRQHGGNQSLSFKSNDPIRGEEEESYDRRLRKAGFSIGGARRLGTSGRANTLTLVCSPKVKLILTSVADVNVSRTEFIDRSLLESAVNDCAS